MNKCKNKYCQDGWIQGEALDTGPGNMEYPCLKCHTKRITEEFISRKRVKVEEQSMYLVTVEDFRFLLNNLVMRQRYE